MIAFLRSIHVSVDSRLSRYIHALDKTGTESLVIQWARGGEKEMASINPRCVTFSLNAGLGGGWRNAIGLLRWMCWSFSALVHHRRDIRAVHAIDLDTALPALLFSILFRKKLIFDIYDSYGDARTMSGIARKMVDMAEALVARCATHVIIPDHCRKSQVPSNARDIRIIENVPFSAEVVTAKRNVTSSARIKLAYVGILEEHFRGLEDLLSAVARLPAQVELHIAGFGQLSEMCARNSRTYANVHFYGPVSSEEALRLMANCDVIVGMYYRSKPHHLRATPNKYYEHLMLAKPLVTTKGTPPGEKVDRDQSGWALVEGAEAIEELLAQIDTETCKIFGENARQKWMREYAQYFDQVLIGEYANGICKV